jgi:hypothetical protein
MILWKSKCSENPSSAVHARPLGVPKMALSVKWQPLARPVVSLPSSECPLDRVRYLIYSSATLAWMPPSDDVAFLVGTTRVRQPAEVPKPDERLIAIIEAPNLSFAHGDDFFINEPCDRANSKVQSATENHLSNPEDSRFTLIMLRAHEALEAAWIGEHDLALIWASPELQKRLYHPLKTLNSIHHFPKAQPQPCQTGAAILGMWADAPPVPGRNRRKER